MDRAGAAGFGCGGLKLSPNLSPAERDALARFVLVFAAIILAWACAHDLWLIHVEPRHFTEFHRPLLPLTDPRLLALQYATVASLGPGMVFGALAYAACRAGRGAPWSLGRVAASFGVVLLAVEVAVVALGRWSLARWRAGGDPPYPVGLYPDFTDGIVFSQSVNISVYLLAPTSGALFLVGCWWARRRRVARPAV